MNGLHALQIGQQAAIWVLTRSDARYTTVGDTNRYFHIEILTRDPTPPELGTYARGQWNPWEQHYTPQPGARWNHHDRDGRYLNHPIKTRSAGWHLDDTNMWNNRPPPAHQICEACWAFAQNLGLTPIHRAQLLRDDPFNQARADMAWEDRQMQIDPVTGL